MPCRRLPGLLFLGAGVLLAAASLSAGEPEKLPWQRTLQGEDARKAAALEKQLAQLREAGKLSEAQEVAERLAQLRSKAQGADHWQAVDARIAVETIRAVLQQGKEEQTDYVRSFALQRQANLLRGQRRYREAQPLLEKVLAGRRKVLGEEHPETARSYGSLAVNLHAQRRYAEAEEAIRKALAIRRKALGEDHPDTAVSYHNLASLLNAQRKYREAEESYLAALAILRKVLGEDHLNTASVLTNLGSSLNAEGKYAEAEEAHRQALAIQRKRLGEEHPQTVSSYNSIAVNQQAQGRYREAEEGFRKVLALRRHELGEDHPQTAQSYNNLAANLHAQGKYREAEEGFRKALTIRRKLLGEEDSDTGGSYSNLAAALNAQGRYAEAEESYRKALAIHRTVLGEEHRETAVSYGNLAANLAAQDRYAEAEEGFRKALAINRKVLGDEHPRTANSFSNLAANQQLQGKHREAEEGIRKALDIRRKVLGEEHPDTAASYNSLAASLKDQHKFREAEEGYRKSLAIDRKVFGEEHPRTAIAYNNVAHNFNAQGRYHEAEEGHKKALDIRRKVLGEEHPDTAIAYSNLAASLNAAGKYQEAESTWKRAADCFARARLRIAASGLGRAAKTGEESPLPSLAAVLARNGKPEEAWQRFEESLARGTWDDLSARLRRPAAEQARQNTLVSRLNRLDQLLESTFSARGESPEHRKRQADLLAQRRQAQEELEALTRRLEQAYGPVAGQVFERRQIQASLPADTALLGWLDIPGESKAADPNGEHWAILLRSQGSPVWLRLTGSGPGDAWTDADTNLPEDLVAALQTPRGDWQRVARRLRRQRLEPLRPHLEGVRHLVVLPSTELAGLPIEVLADNLTVSYALSGTLYTYLHQQAKSAGTGLLALADPIFETPAAEVGSSKGPWTASATRGGEGPWPPLPGTRVEVEALHRLFDREARLLCDAQASEQQLYRLAQDGELGRYRYVHLATHGVVDPRFPLRSAVLLSRDALPDPGQQLAAGLPVYDGRLTAEEVLRQWQLHSELVTLSACQTALGKHESGEGFIGFAQALILSGSKSVCLSLWKVDDAATALLMERFYQNLLGKREGLSRPMSKAEALAEAKRWLRELPQEEAVRRSMQLSRGVARGKGRPVQPLLPAVPAPSGGKDERPYAHPYFWAAFVLIGDPS